MIEVCHLTARSDAARLTDVCVSAHAGELVAVLATDESQRTLLADCLTGCAPYAGDIAVCGVDLARYPIEAKSHMGYAPDMPALYSDMTGRAALRFVAEARELPPRDVDRLIERALALTDATACADTRVGVLSMHLKRRLNLAQALLHDPEALVLDNPTGALDPRETVLTRDLLTELKDGRAIVALSNSINDVYMADRIVLLDAGRVAYTGALAGLYDPRYAQALRKTAGDWFDPEAFRAERE